MKTAKSMLKVAAILGVVLGMTAPASAAGDTEPPINFDWTFGGVFGKFDRAQLQRGFQVYKEVCSSCHSLERIYFRNLAEEGGPEFNLEVIKVLARETKVTEVDFSGELAERNGQLGDILPSPFDNAAQAAAALGAAPPDLSLITKSRTSERHLAQAFVDMATGRTALLGTDYVASLLIGYEDPPADAKLDDGQSWNKYFPNNVIAMAPPLSDGAVDYSEADVPETVEQYALDVSAFLHWAAEPHLEKRKRIGLVTVIFLLILAALLYFANRKLWSGVKKEKTEAEAEA